MGMQAENERRYKAKIGNRGIISGSVLILDQQRKCIEKKNIDNVAAELLRLEKALEESKKQLQELYELTVKEADEESAAIFEIHQMMMEGSEFKGAVQKKIEEEKINAEYALEEVESKLTSVFESMDDEYMSARAADIRDISMRLMNNLQGESKEIQDKKEPFILFAQDLSPSQLMQIDKKKLLGIVTIGGSANSHTAILSRILDIPYLYGLKEVPEKVEMDQRVLIEGENGVFILAPSENTLNKSMTQIEMEKQEKKSLMELKGKESITLNGKKIAIYANVGSVEEIEMVLENDAEGIGLFRSEFLYLERQDFPTEEEQFQIYREILEKMQGRKTIIRTMDIGADKKISYFNLPEEENPALGYRAIRICLKQKDIFKTQLKALFRAGIYGNLSIMYPMIISVKEVNKIHEIIEEVKNELEEDNILYKVPEQGIMIETPAAVMISEELAELVDFFSIGTNDLTQYTLAIDRQNEKLDDFYEVYHPAILRMIQMVVDNAHKAGKWAGICGELGADEKLTEAFIKMGVDELSVVPSKILKLRKIVRTIEII